MSTTAGRAAQTGLCPGHNIIMNMIYNVAVSIEPIFWIDDLCEMIDNLLQSTKQRAVLSMGTAIELRQRANREDTLSIETLRSEEHTSELQSLMRISYAVFCLKKNKN